MNSISISSSTLDSNLGAINDSGPTAVFIAIS